MFYKSVKFLFFIYILIPLNYSQLLANDDASLSIYPQFIKLDDKNQSSNINVFNQGLARGGYTLELVNMEMSDKGSVREVENSAYSIKDCLRLAPRSFNLDAKASQIIRVLARVPKDLEDGEYRAGMKVILADKNLDNSDRVMQGNMLGISAIIRSKIALIVPIVYQHGKISYDVNMENMEMVERINKNGNIKRFFRLDFTRTGNRSASGDLKISYVDQNGLKHQLSTEKVSIWRNIDHKKLEHELKIPEGLEISENGRFKLLFESATIDNKGQRVIDKSVVKEKDFKVVKLKEYSLVE